MKEQLIDILTEGLRKLNRGYIKKQEGNIILKKDIITRINTLFENNGIPINADKFRIENNNLIQEFTFVYNEKDFSLIQLSIDEICEFNFQLFAMGVVENISEYLTFLLFDKIYKEILELDKESISVFNKGKLLHEINIYLYENEIIRANYLVTNEDVCINTYPVKEFIQDNTKVILYEMQNNN